MICVFGSINIDLVCRVAEIARPGETVLSPGYTQYSGGKGANQAVAAARAGAIVEMVGAVGADGLGDAAKANLGQNGVGISGVSTVDLPTGCAFIVVSDDGENAITVASGANRAVSDAFSHEPSILVCQMELAAGVTLRAMQIARRSGARTLLNFAPVPAGMDRSVLVELLEVTDYLAVNELEMSALCEALSVVRSGETLAEHARCYVIVTRGDEGISIYHPDPEAKSLALSAPSVHVVDTTGAGDTFVGVLASGLGEGTSLNEAARRAMFSATLACRSFGAQSAMPSSAELQAYCDP